MFKLYMKLYVKRNIDVARNVERYIKNCVCGFLTASALVLNLVN